MYVQYIMSRTYPADHTYTIMTCIVHASSPSCHMLIVFSTHVWHACSPGISYAAWHSYTTYSYSYWVCVVHTLCASVPLLWLCLAWSQRITIVSTIALSPSVHTLHTLTINQSYVYYCSCMYICLLSFNCN